MSSNFNDESNKSASELEREADAQRGRIEDTIAQLMESFSPSRMLNQFLNSSGGNGDMSRQLMAAMRENPVPTFLAATGIGWLLFSQSRNQSSGGAGLRGNNVPARESYGVDPDYDPHTAEGHVALEKQGSSSRTGGYGHDLESMVGSQPLALGVIGLALGALVGASLPRSQREDQMLGGYGDQLRDRAREFSDEARSRYNDDYNVPPEGGESEKTQH